jgi:hypothetical protein
MRQKYPEKYRIMQKHQDKHWQRDGYRKAICRMWNRRAEAATTAGGIV